MGALRLGLKLLATLFALSGAVGAARADVQTPAQFYAGKTVSLIIPNAPGGSFDLYGRLVARFLSRHIPGNPTIVPQNMPGASGMIAANWMFGPAPQDGSVIGILIPNIVLAQVMDLPQIQYDVRRWNWLGRVVAPTATLFAWHTSKTQSLAQLKTQATLIASTGPLSQAEVASNMLNGVVGTKFKIIRGYSGTGDAIIALQQGEVETAVMPWTFMKLAHPDWLANKEVAPIAQYTRRPIADLPNVPSIFALAKTSQQQGVFKLFFGPDEIGQPLVAPPRTPPDRVLALRRAFDEMNKDPDYIAEAAKEKLALTPASADDLKKSVADAFAATPEEIRIAKQYYK
jgi:tripartite-type tricarboxylate transporter receptor subunit TctC